MNVIAFLIIIGAIFPKWVGGPMIRDLLIAWNEGKRLYAEHAAKKGTP